MGKLSYLLDSNILSEPLKPMPNPGVMDGLLSHNEQCATAAVVWHELRYGYERLPDGRKKQIIGNYLERLASAALPILPYEQNAAAWHANERARLANLGLTPSFADGQIAAIAQANNLILVSRNTADYSGFKGLKVENWFS
ncbi:MAG: type II toxin-antitoxin system VapC family toxin [Sulfuricellaceae bacterium]|nr:type II toxin-antitoxin system VapC family toxin [Sulfuricellaceae bacterium]